MNFSVACNITCQFSTRSRFLISYHVVFRNHAGRSLVLFHKRAVNSMPPLFDTNYPSRGMHSKHACYEDELCIISNHSTPLLPRHTLCRNVSATTPCTIEHPLDNRYSIYSSIKTVLLNPPGKFFWKGKFFSSPFYFQN